MSNEKSALRRLVLALKELRKIAHKNTQGYGCEYMSLPSLLEKAEQCLSPHDLAVFQQLEIDKESKNVIYTAIMDLPTSEVLVESRVLLHDLKDEPRTCLLYTSPSPRD